MRIPIIKHSPHPATLVWLRGEFFIFFLFIFKRSFCKDSVSLRQKRNLKSEKRKR